MALEPAKLSDFKLAGKLGTGTTAMVYGAVHIATGRSVAIKVMAEAGPNHERRERFAREALLLASVQSRHVCKILGFGFEKGQPFLVLERLHGETLDAKLRRDGPVPPAVGFRWIEQLIMGVRDCHAAKIIHRDIKPSNVFLHRDESGETVKLIDFGVARLREISGSGEGLTSVSHLIGSMGYMAPEQFANAKTVGFTADLYAVGVVVFRTITGRLPFVSRSLEAVVRMKSEQPVPLVSSMPGMSENPLLDTFVQTAMVRDPGARFQSAREMLEQWGDVMTGFEKGPPLRHRRDIGESDDSSSHRRASAGQTAIPLPSHVVDPTAPLPKVTDDDPSTGEETVRRPSGTNVAWSARSESDAATTEFPAYDDLGAATISSHDEGWPDPEEVPATTEASPPQTREKDPFDLPTRPDANLRTLVEQELELHRARVRARG